MSDEDFDDVLPISRLDDFSNLASGQMEIDDNVSERSGTTDSESQDRPRATADTQVSQKSVGLPSFETKKAPIWKHFHTSSKDSNKAVCNYCKMEFSIKTGSTTSLHRHLVAKHKQHSELFLADQAKKEDNLKQKKLLNEPSKKQTTLAQCFDKSTSWPSDHPRAKALTNKVAIWMAKNLHPYSLVEEEGLIDVLKEASPKYKLPSRNTFSRRIIPELYQTKKQSIMNEINEDLPNVQSLSFTTDLWTSRSNDPFMSLTLHYMSPDFRMKRFCLSNEYLPSEHDAHHIAQKFQHLMTEWKLDDHDNTIPIYTITDNAANMIAAMRMFPSFSHIHCFAHTLQLALKDAKKNTQGMTNMLSTARSIVGHYKRSASAQQRLHEYQKNLRKKQVELIQDVETRWNSEYQMLSRLVQQKEAIAGELLASQANITCLTSTEWKLAEEYVDILSPLDEATKRTSSSSSPTMSMVIPLIHTIENVLEKRLSEKKPGAMFCRSLLNSMKTRFADMKSNSLYKMCMAVDPHFKCAVLQPHEKSLVRDNLAKEAMAIYKKKLTEPSRPTQMPQEDKPGCSYQPTDFWSTFEDLAGKKTVNPSAEEPPADNAHCLSELDVFFAEPRISPKDNSLKWWRENQNKYHYLAPLARKYLGIPATEVDSERVFSAAGNVVTMRRESLAAEHVQELVFLHENL